MSNIKDLAGFEEVIKRISPELQVEKCCACDDGTVILNVVIPQERFIRDSIEIQRISQSWIVFCENENLPYNRVDFQVQVAFFKE